MSSYAGAHSLTAPGAMRATRASGAGLGLPEEDRLLNEPVPDAASAPSLLAAEGSPELLRPSPEDLTRAEQARIITNATAF